MTVLSGLQFAQLLRFKFSSVYWFVREHALIAAVYQMTIDLEEKHKTDRTRVLKSGSIWLGDERRKHPRAEVDEAAYVSSGGASTRCRVLNISTKGAAIDVPNAAYIPDRFQLMTEKDRVIRKCRVVWIQQNRIGVAFEQESRD
jgi:hypothetical protein